MTNSTSSEAQATLEVRADGQGEWQAQLPSDLAPGLHTVVVTTENGESQEIAMYSLQKETRTLSNTIKEIPWAMVYPLIFLLVLILVLALNNLRLMVTGKGKVKDGKRHVFSLVLVMLAVITSSLLVGYVVWDLKKGTYADSTQNTVQQGALVAPISQLSGAVIDPWSGIPLSGAKLTIGDVTINTQDGGRFNFSSVPAGGRINLAHASMTKDVLFDIAADGNGLMDIFFEPKTYNSIIDTLRAEATGDLSAVYANLPDGLKAKIDEKDFLGSYVKTAESAELLNGDLVIKKAWVEDNRIDSVNQLTYPRVLLLDLELGGRQGRYGVAYENGRYKIFKQ